MENKKYFITYGDATFEAARTRIIDQAKNIKEFDVVLAYGRDDLSSELLSSEIINEKRGGGYWCWKPDIILSTMRLCGDGDIIVYSDAGGTLQRSREWSQFWRQLECYDIIAQRIFQRNSHWTRREIVDYFKNNGTHWLRLYQYQAQIILKVTPFTRMFIAEWRDLMLRHPEFVKDVPAQLLANQMPGFIENRHDQSIYSALIYKYLNDPNVKDKVFTQWEHMEDLDLFCRQAIRATRFRNNEKETLGQKFKAATKRIVKDFIFKPFFYAPLQWWYSR